MYNYIYRAAPFPTSSRAPYIDLTSSISSIFC